MKKQPLLSFLLACLAAMLTAAPAPPREGRQLQFEHLSIEDGLSQSTARQILQDRRGFTWISTFDGLNKYDGQHFTRYAPVSGNPHSISDEKCTALCETKDGFLWVGTQANGLNRFDPETERFTRFLHQPDNPASLGDNRITTLLEDDNGVLWIGTSSAGLHRYNRETGTFTRFTHQAKEPLTRSRNEIFDICADRRGKLRLATRRGIDLFDPATGTFRLFLPNPKEANGINGNSVFSICNDSSGNTWAAGLGGRLYKLTPSGETITQYNVSIKGRRENIVTYIHEDREGTLWLGTNREGLKKFDPETGKFSTYLHDYNNPTSLSSNDIFHIYEDRSGLLWIGTSGGGVNMLNRRKEKFETYRHNPNDPNSLGGKVVLSIFEGRGNVLWMAISGEGLDKLDQKTGTFTHYRNDPKKTGGLVSNYLYCAIEDRDGIVWIGTQRAGLERLDPETGVFTHHFPKRNDPNWLLHPSVSYLAEDKDGNLWIATLEGLNRRDKKTGRFTAFRHDPEDPRSLGGELVEILYLDRSDNLWACTPGHGVSKLTGPGPAFTRYTHDPENPGSLSDDDVICVYEALDGIFWFGTAGNGLNRMDPGPKTFKHYTQEQGLPNNVVYGILEDKGGNLWLSTNRGICCFNPGAERFKNYTPGSGIQGYEFNTRAFFKNKEGKMYFGGTDGFSCFFPGEIRDNPYIPPVALTGFYLFGRPVGTGGDSPLEKDISFTRELVLSHRQNIFGFQFAALDYTAPENNRYKYRMDGLHDDWIHLGNKRDISFAGLDPGNYTFRVTGSNNDGLWNEEGLKVAVTITPPFWKTFWFRLSAVLLCIALVIAWHRRRLVVLSARLRAEASMELLFEKYQVSKREREIVHLILEGKTNRDIEAELFISVRTVKCHVYNIYQKVGVKNRMELINLFHGAPREE